LRRGFRKRGRKAKVVEVEIDDASISRGALRLPQAAIGLWLSPGKAKKRGNESLLISR
jgi:hypothetical protein